MLYTQIRDEFISMLRDIDMVDRSRYTIRKANLTNPSMMEDLYDDQAFIFTLLDQSIASVNNRINASLRPVILATRFGQKEHRSVSLSDYFCNDKIISYSVHSACTVASNTNFHLLFSRQCICSVIGDRGRVFNVLGLREAGNYQSNLDGKRTDLPNNLRSISSFPTNITFLQMYADTL